MTDEHPILEPKQPPLETVPLQKLPKHPLVSIIVPSFEQGEFVREAIETILAQEYRPLKIHVVDGGSNDDTVEILKSFGEIPELDWISEPDRGVVHAVNKGFTRVAGEIIGIQSSDDTYLPGTFVSIVEQFLSDQELGLIYGDTEKIDAAGNLLGREVIGPYSLENIFLFKTWIPQPSAFFRRKLLEACGGWDEQIPYAPDTDLWIRMAFRTKVKKLNRFLSQRRMHDAQRDTQSDKIVRSFTQLIDQSLDLKKSSSSLRSAASAARHLIRCRYNPPNSDLYRAWHIWRAGCHDQRVKNSGAVLRWGTMPIRRVLSRCKQKMLGSITHNKQPWTGPM